MEVYIIYGDEGKGIVDVYANLIDAQNRLINLEINSDGIFYFIQTHTVL